MYLRKSLLSAILICLHGMGSSQVLLSSAALSTLNQLRTPLFHPQYRVKRLHSAPSHLVWANVSWESTMSDLRADSSLLHLPTRRSFVKGAGAAMLVAGRAWARTDRVSPSNRITLGVIGWGMMGPPNTKAFLQQSDCQVVAACDLHTVHLQSAVDTINNRYGNKDCKA